MRIKSQTSFVGLLIGILVLVIFAVPLVIGVINQQIITTSLSKTNTSENNTNSKSGTTDTLANRNLVSGTDVITTVNSSDASIDGGVVLTRGTNYTINYGDSYTNAKVTYISTSPGANLVNITYQYSPGLTDTSIVTLLKLIPLFVALALLLYVLMSLGLMGR